MRIRELVKEIVDDTLTDSEILKYCKGFDAEGLKDLLQELWFEKEAFERVGKLSDAQRLDDVYKLISKYFSVDFLKDEAKNNEERTDTQSLNLKPQQIALKDLLPEKLKTDEAVKVFQNAIGAQLITYSPEGLKWNDTKQLLAYFATKASDKFSLSTKVDKDGNTTTAWKPFENLFKVQGLKDAKQNWLRVTTHFNPTGFEKVDALF